MCRHRQSLYPWYVALVRSVCIYIDLTSLFLCSGVCLCFPSMCAQHQRLFTWFVTLVRRADIYQDLMSLLIFRFFLLAVDDQPAITGPLEPLLGTALKSLMIAGSKLPN
jgi:hypothetical protein